MKQQLDITPISFLEEKRDELKKKGVSSEKIMEFTLAISWIQNQLMDCKSDCINIENK
jgi:alkylhydroperoxidase family enzyme